MCAVASLVSSSALWRAGGGGAVLTRYSSAHASGSSSSRRVAEIGKESSHMRQRSHLVHTHTPMATGRPAGLCVRSATLTQSKIVTTQVGSRCSTCRLCISGPLPPPPPLRPVTGSLAHTLLIELVPFDPEIERTITGLRVTRRSLKKNRNKRNK